MSLVVVVIGVCGSGKSTLGSELARRFSGTFLDADAFHSAANRAKLAVAEPLTDADRAGWLTALRLELERRSHETVVLACSALKRAYRAALLAGLERKYLVVFLHGAPEVLGERLVRRTGHFASPLLLASQLATLEEPGDDEGCVVRVPVEWSTAAQAEHVARSL